MSGEGQIKMTDYRVKNDSANNTTTNIGSGTIEREYRNFEAEELGFVEQEVASKIRLLSNERKSDASFNRSDALLQLNMRSKNDSSQPHQLIH